jgi:hypothetical protein
LVILVLVIRILLFLLNQTVYIVRDYINLFFNNLSKPADSWTEIDSLKNLESQTNEIPKQEIKEISRSHQPNTLTCVDEYLIRTKEKVILKYYLEALFYPKLDEFYSHQTKPGIITNKLRE